jgi:hypothetical protein
VAKGSVENSNGRIRRFLPLGTDITLLSNQEIIAVTERMNHTPRKCLEYRSPCEVLAAQAAGAGKHDRVLLPCYGASGRVGCLGANGEPGRSEGAGPCLGQ